MTENIALTELIDRYLGGELTFEEKQAFERRLSTEAALSEQVALHRQITASIKSSGRASLLAALQEEDAKMPAYQEVAELPQGKEAKVIAFGSTSRQMYYWAAAAVLLLLVPFLFIINNNTSADKLVANYFSPHENQWVSPNGDTAELSTQAMKHYEKENYALALPILEKMLGESSADAEVQFYKGNSHLALSHAKDAIACFEAVLAMSDNKYTQEAQWYLALSYIKDNQKQKAKDLLNKIVETSDHPFNKDAAELLKKL